MRHEWAMPRQRFETRWTVLLLGLLLGAAGCSQSKIAGDGRAADAPDRIPALVRLASVVQQRVFRYKS